MKLILPLPALLLAPLSALQATDTVKPEIDSLNAIINNIETRPKPSNCAA